MKIPVAPLRKIVKEELFYREFYRKAREEKKKNDREDEGKAKDES